MTRYPLEPLADALRIDIGTPGRPHDDDRADHGLVALSAHLGVTDRTLRRLRCNGLTDRQADHFAIVAGLHPAEIWPTWFDDAPGEGDDWYADDAPMRPPARTA